MMSLCLDELSLFLSLRVSLVSCCLSVLRGFLFSRLSVFPTPPPLDAYTSLPLQSCLSLFLHALACPKGQIKRQTRASIFGHRYKAKTGAVTTKAVIGKRRVVGQTTSGCVRTAHGLSKGSPLVKLLLESIHSERFLQHVVHTKTAVVIERTCEKERKLSTGVRLTLHYNARCTHGSLCLSRRLSTMFLSCLFDLCVCWI